MFFNCLDPILIHIPKRILGSNSNKIIWLKQTLKHVEIIRRETAEFDMRYKELKDPYRRAWEEDFKFVLFDRSKKKDEGNHTVQSQSKNFYIGSPETETF